MGMLLPTCGIWGVVADRAICFAISCDQVRTSKRFPGILLANLAERPVCLNC